MKIIVIAFIVMLLGGAGCAHRACSRCDRHRLASVRLDDVSMADALRMPFRMDAGKFLIVDVPDSELEQMRVTLELDNVDIRDVLLAIAAQGNLDVTFQPNGLIRISKSQKGANKASQVTSQ